MRVKVERRSGVAKAGELACWLMGMGTGMLLAVEIMADARQREVAEHNDRIEAFVLRDRAGDE
jgi:hypothetical protein